jgi:hypothetical protein
VLFGGVPEVVDAVQGAICAHSGNGSAAGALDAEIGALERDDPLDGEVLQEGRRLGLSRRVGVVLALEQRWAGDETAQGVIGRKQVRVIDVPDLLQLQRALDGLQAVEDGEEGRRAGILIYEADGPLADADNLALAVGRGVREHGIGRDISDDLVQEMRGQRDRLTKRESGQRGAHVGDERGVECYIGEFTFIMIAFRACGRHASESSREEGNAPGESEHLFLG